MRARLAPQVKPPPIASNITRSPGLMRPSLIATSNASGTDAAEVLATLAPEEILVPSVAELAPELGSYDQLLSSSKSDEEVAYVV